MLYRCYPKRLQQVSVTPSTFLGQKALAADMAFLIRCSAWAKETCFIGWLGQVVTG